MLQYGNASRVVDALRKLDDCRSTPVTLAVEEYLKREGKSEKISSKDDEKDDNSANIRPLHHEFTADSVSKISNTEVSTWKKGLLANSYGSLKDLKERHDTEEQSIVNKMQSHLSRLVSSLSFNDKIYHMSTLSPSQQTRKSTVIRLSYCKRASCEGEATTEFCKNIFADHFL